MLGYDRASLLVWTRTVSSYISLEFAKQHAYNHSNSTLLVLTDWAQDHRLMPRAAYQRCSVTDGKQPTQNSGHAVKGHVSNGANSNMSKILIKLLKNSLRTRHKYGATPGVKFIDISFQ